MSAETPKDEMSNKKINPTITTVEPAIVRLTSFSSIGAKLTTTKEEIKRKTNPK
jgi:hypothetical protein